ncbi:restriction endonuclease subunit S [Nostoc commune]|uniref:restriction endonuclease subunit S n=1 Tax=Nostoc commune TaxID=1178 RepID=UPI0018C54EEA|nr:restriction endonuclease subunit S [Nostoc commune]
MNFELDKNLPECWEIVTIGEITLPYETEQPAKKPETEFKYIDIGSIDNSTQTITNIKTFLGKDAPSRARRIVRKDDILFSTVRTYLKNIARVPAELDGVLTSTGIAVLRCTSGIDRKFLFYSVLSDKFIRKISSTMDGTLYPAVTDTDVTSAAIVIPPLNEQRRIVAKIEALKARSQRVKEALEDIPQLLDQFRQSVLAAAFRGDLTADWREQNSNVEPASVLLERIRAERRKQYEKECDIAKKEQKNKPRKPENLEQKVYSNNYIVDIPECWIWTSFADIAAITKYSMSSGPFGSALGLKDYIDNGIPVIRGQNIQKGKFVLKFFVYISEEKASQLIRSIAYPGDIVIVAVGSSGQAAIVPKELPYAVLSQNCNKFTLDTSWVVPDFVLMLLQNEIAKSQMQDKITDTVRQFLSLTNLKSMLLPIPPLEEQKEIVYRVNALFRIVDIVNFQYQQIKGNLDHFDQSILAKAFRGELVPQDPNDEPASVLLERIRAERAKLQTKAAKKSTPPTGGRRSKKASQQEAEPVQLELGLE